MHGTGVGALASFVICCNIVNTSSRNSRWIEFEVSNLRMATKCNGHEHCNVGRAAYPEEIVNKFGLHSSQQQASTESVSC